MFKLLLIFAFTDGHAYTQANGDDWFSQAACENQGNWLKAQYVENMKQGYYKTIQSIRVECKKI